MKIYNSTQNKMVLEDAKVADNFISRTIGLLSKKALNKGEGLIIKSCNSIHTFFMKFAIDVLFVDKNNRVIALYENVKPWRVLPIHLSASYVIELEAGSICEKKIYKDDYLSFERP